MRLHDLLLTLEQVSRKKYYELMDHEVDVAFAGEKSKEIVHVHYVPEVNTIRLEIE